MMCLDGSTSAPDYRAEEVVLRAARKPLDEPDDIHSSMVSVYSKRFIGCRDERY